MSPPRWRIFYGDSSTFSSEDGGPEDAPPWDVQAVVFRCDGESPVLHSYDYYWYEGGDGEWLGGDLVGLIDYLARPGWKRVLLGRHRQNRDFLPILDRATHDPDFT